MGLRVLDFVVTRSAQRAGFKVDRFLLIKKPKSDAVVTVDTDIRPKMLSQTHIKKSVQKGHSSYWSMPELIRHNTCRLISNQHIPVLLV